MQDLHAVVGGRMFDAAAMERLLRPLNHHGNHQALKCPRCDSVNTKFCYYNNYNLSQPRHFCKNCRRYWTKGGVLRNVPVGGGCRKNKRSKPKLSPTTKAAVTGAEVPTMGVSERKSTSHSSSDSSGLTAAAVCGPDIGGSCFGRGAFAGIDGLEPIPGGFNFSDVRGLLSQQRQDTWQQQDQIPGAFLDQTVQVDFSTLQSGFGPFDWQPISKDQGELDLASSTVDQAYWSQSQIQWTDHDHPGLFLP